MAIFVNELLPFLMRCNTLAERSVLTAIAARVNKDGDAFPSLRIIAQDAGICERSASYAIASLCNYGLLEKKTEPGVKTVYTFAPAPAPSPVVEPEPPEPTALPCITSPEAKPAKRATRLPDDWKLPLAWGMWAMQDIGMTEEAVRWEADKFSDYWHSRAGRGATKMNWHATWRNWIRKNAESGGTASGVPQSKSKMTQALDNLANLKLDWEHPERWNPFASRTKEEIAAAQKREEARAAARIAEAAKMYEEK